MISIRDLDGSNLIIDKEWNYSDNQEYLMHTIHAYPAKFPAFIASKAFSYAEDEGVNVKSVSDIFCGCGTVALEAKIHNKNFWGCDINPVATLIAKTKSAKYRVQILEKYYHKIQDTIYDTNIEDEVYLNTNERLRYWYSKRSFNELYKIKQAIYQDIPTGKYRTAFLCLFSSILKASSRWLTKSIKPQVDKEKEEINIQALFERQFRKFCRSVLELTTIPYDSSIEIRNVNFLSVRKYPKVDLIITSPPYVTSYEYADLHQLSSLWLGYADDYRDLRKGSIGSTYNSEGLNFEAYHLNKIGESIVRSLYDCCGNTSKTRSVARYYHDMQDVVGNCIKMLNNHGMAFFVVGDTEYKGVKIKNSMHLIQSLTDVGFSDIKVGKRKISNKLLTPYRDYTGKFTSDKSQRTVYHEELIISGRV